ncbi:MAG TPA: RNA-directed DNA polymerase, partial [Candidatus Saccharimonadales bacterium]|nr:RNA-directed DNA polymerase [Candidatus Saccharimonadales bacterium]
FEVPKYLNFEELLILISAWMIKKEFANICKMKDGKPDYPHKYEKINHVILSNKDSAYSWRPLQIIHPVLYVYLVRLITEKNNWAYIQGRFQNFSNTIVNCISVPRESDGEQSDKASQVSHWWENIEQHSIKKSLEYNHVFLTDISDCYGSIYTHTIEWALDKDGKDAVKKRLLEEKKPKKTLGNKIDATIRSMSYNQTNGIPQGSTLMDFIAEIVLGYCDELLTKLIGENGINREDYYIIRYRDDYRIFVNDPNIGHKILKLLSVTLYELGMKLNAVKTKDSDDIILASVKKEKLERIASAPANQSLQKEALRIYQLSKNYPNSGLISKELSLFYDRLGKYKIYKNKEEVEPIIVILTMVSFMCPKVINWVSAIISILLNQIKTIEKRNELILNIHNRFKKIPQTGLIDIWLQRISEPSGITIDYTDNLTKVALGIIKNSDLWYSFWLRDEVTNLINLANVSTFSRELKEKKISSVIQRDEVELFKVAYF